MWNGGLKTGQLITTKTEFRVIKFCQIADNRAKQESAISCRDAALIGWLKAVCLNEPMGRVRGLLFRAATQMRSNIPKHITWGDISANYH